MNREEAPGTLRGTHAVVPAGDAPIRHEASHHAMGTMFSIAAYAPGSLCLENVVERAFQEIDRIDNLMSHYKPESELSRINREAYGHPVVVTPELFRVLEEAFRLSEETGGAFDVTVGPLMKAWGFFRGWGRLPDEPELAEALKGIGYRHVKLDAATRTVSFDEPGIELDPGAIGKGYAVDRVVEMLRGEGVASALVSSGTSSIYALGAPPGEQGWEISVCDPFDRRKQACSLLLRNLSISISGDYEKSFVLNGKLYTHILDPSTGRPVEKMLMTVVIAPSNRVGDALSTAFFAAGVERSREYLQKHPDLTAMFFQPKGASRSFEQIVLKSSANALPADSFVQM